MHYVQIFAILFAFIPGGLSKCSAGYYLVDGVVEAKKNKCALCPSGRYGDYSGATTSDCSGLCSRGHYCPPGSTSNKEKQCPAGTYGKDRGLSSAKCSGLSQAGYYTNPGAVSSRQHTCGITGKNEDQVFCPEGSGSPRHVDTGYYTIPLISASSTTRQAQKQCEPGWYCKNGIKNPCPPGVYGRNAGLSTKECSGPCPAGSYCVMSSILPKPCPVGVYGNKAGLTTKDCSGQCPVGSYCEMSSILPKLCPAGYFGNRKGLSNRFCSNTCTPGFYCPFGSKSAKERQCGRSDVFCPKGSSQPTPVSLGYYTLPLEGEDGNFPETTRSHQLPCPPGSYCVRGLKILCPSGTYSTQSKTSDPVYTLNPGYSYQRNGSTWNLKGTLKQCKIHCSMIINNGGCKGFSREKNANDNDTVHCVGIYNNGNTDYFSDNAYTTYTKEKTCEGNCSEGYYCPTGSITSTAKQCGGISVYCPAASPKPIKVSIGFYTTKGGKNTRSSQVICPPGSYCVGGERIKCPPGVYGLKSGLDSQLCSGNCPAGNYCPLGSITPIPCPPGTYGSTEGLTNNKCTGPCAAGYYCPEGSSSSFRECGGERYFCPHGSGSRQDVTSGHYSFGGTTLTRHGQRLCIAGADSEHSCPSTTISEIEKSPSNHLESNTAWRTSTR